MPLNDTYQPTIFPIPDEYTANAIMYGSAYTFQLSSKFYWDQVQDQLEQDIERLKRKLINKEFAAYVMNNAQHMVFANPPPSNNPDEIRDLWTLREIVRKGTALRQLDMRRMENRLWSEMMGVSEYARKVNADDISEERWKSATMGQMAPIDFETIRALRDEEPIMAKKEVEEYMSEEARLRAQAKEFRNGYNEWLREMDRSVETDEDFDDDYDDDEDDDRTQPEITIWRDEMVDEEDVELTPYSSPTMRDIAGVIRWMAYDPIIVAVSQLTGGDVHA